MTEDEKIQIEFFDKLSVKAKKLDYKGWTPEELFFYAAILGASAIDTNEDPGDAFIKFIQAVGKFCKNCNGIDFVDADKEIKDEILGDMDPEGHG